MKIRYVLPLGFFLGAAIGPALFLMPRNVFMILGFASFLFGFYVTYLSMVKETINNKDAVLKLGERKPFIMPILLFVVPTIVSTLIFIPREIAVIVQFSGCIAMSCVAYGIGTAIVLADLRRGNASPPNARASIHAGKKILVLVNPVNPHKTGLTVNKSSRFPPRPWYHRGPHAG